MQTIPFSKQTGISLLEVLIAVVVISIGLLGLAGLQVASLQTSQGANARQNSTIAAQSLLERMRGNRQAALDGLYNGTHTVATLCSTPLSSCSSGGSCSRADLVANDLRIVACGHASGASSKTALNQIMGSSLTISCPEAGDCSQRIRIHISWSERTAYERSAATDSLPSTPETEDVFMQVDARL